MKKPAIDLETFLEMNKDTFGAPKFDIKEIKKRQIKGQKYDITSYWLDGVKEPKTTTYMSTHKGLQENDTAKAKILDKGYTSVLTGGVLPDVQVMRNNTNRVARFSSDLKNMERRDFTYTGDDWN